MALLDASEIDALAAASTPSSAAKSVARSLPFSVGRGDHEVARGLAALDTYVPALRRRLRERLRHQTRQQLDVEDTAPRARTVEELITQHGKPVIAELGGGMGLPPAFMVFDETAARVLALGSMGVKAADADAAAAITPGELLLLTRMMHVLVHDLAEVLPSNAPAQPLRFLRLLTDPRLITSTGPILSLPFSLRGDIETRFELALPASWLVRPKTGSGSTSTPKKPGRRIGDDHSLVMLDLSAELGRAQMTLRRLLALVPGDVVHLMSSPNRPLPVLVQRSPRLRGRPEVQDGRVCIVVDSDPAFHAGSSRQRVDSHDESGAHTPDFPLKNDAAPSILSSARSSTNGGALHATVPPKSGA